jgi:hypothetical protein
MTRSLLLPISNVSFRAASASLFQDFVHHLLAVDEQS